ncbi:hypothetical protein D025_2538 [Vibrio parahaemolyticus 949]|nr:hypothetical protein D036_3235 [Vibrio parahaemolyticus VP232]EQM37031.1 hypothetical protein D025_2538 [Vibrio parahaemolyticus 949]ETS20788.1 hypothetical protein D033_3749 [Vibrio parahaemolyticus B-265]
MWHVELLTPFSMRNLTFGSLESPKPAAFSSDHLSSMPNGSSAFM